MLHRRQRADNNTTGFRAADNPPINAGNASGDLVVRLAKSVGLSFDDITKGGTGALVIGDVGQNRFEDRLRAPRAAAAAPWLAHPRAHDE